jgi:tetratricopeptide (TPR) repeat protein
MFRTLIVILAVSLLLPQARADDEQPSNPSAHVLQAEIALSRGEYLRAAQEYRKAAEAGNDVEHARRATLVADSFGFNDEAIRSAKRWLVLDENDELALGYLARLQLRTGDLRSARRNFKKLVAKGDGEPGQRILALVQALEDEDVEDVYELIAFLAKPYDESANAQHAVAVTALDAGKDDVAMERAQKTIELEPDWLRPRFVYGRALLIAGREDEAIDYIARIIGDDPDPDPEARMELAVIMMSVGRDDDALSQVNQVLLERPSQASALRLMAIINFRQQNLDAAWQDFEDLLASGQYTNDAFYYLARIADFRENHEQAMLLYSEVTRGSRAVSAQRRAAAILAFQLENEDQALQQLDDFGRDHPAHAIEMMQSKAQLLASLDRHQEALDLFDQLARYRPDEESVALGRAELLLNMDRLEDAIAAYRAAAKRWPDSPTTLNALGYTLADRTDRYREAEKLIRRAIKLDPENAAIIDSLGWVLFKRGNNAEALVELKRAYELFDDAEVAAHLVEVLYVMERKDEALEMLTAAESKDPDSRFLKDVRERMFPGSTDD